MNSLKISQLESKEARILYIIYSLYQNNQISLIQKGLLKDYLITGECSKFMSAINIFEKTKDYDQLTQFLIKFIGSECSFSDYVSVESNKTIKSTVLIDNSGRTTQGTDTNINQFVLCSNLQMRKKSQGNQFVQRKEKKYLTQIQ